MNILLTHFQIQDYGGIVNYSEYLARGFKALGCSVDAVMLRNKGTTGTPATKPRSGSEGWQYGEGLGLWMHQKAGWEGMPVFNYARNIQDWPDLTFHYDLVIHVVPVPTKTKANQGDDQWIAVFEDCLAPQIAVVHDGNMRKLYPHIHRIESYLDGVVCVHDAAFNSCEMLSARRVLVPNPHELPFATPPEPWERDGVVSLQTFKRWKRVDDLVRAFAHMDEFIPKILCGGGIEYYYMTSENKCKTEYINEDGTRIWDAAMYNGMEFRGYVDTHTRDELLQQCKLLVDPSWSKNYSQLGCHFNRVMVEAMAHGCVPVCTDLAMARSLYFTADEHFIEIPYDISPQGYAAILEGALADENRLERIQQANLELVKEFDYDKICERIIEFALHNDGGRRGKPTDEFVAAAKKKMEFFEGL